MTLGQRREDESADKRRYHRRRALVYEGECKRCQEHGGESADAEPCRTVSRASEYSLLADRGYYDRAEERREGDNIRRHRRDSDALRAEDQRERRCERELEEHTAQGAQRKRGDMLRMSFAARRLRMNTRTRTKTTRTAAAAHHFGRDGMSVSQTAGISATAATNAVIMINDVRSGISAG